MTRLARRNWTRRHKLRKKFLRAIQSFLHIIPVKIPEWDNMDFRVMTLQAIGCTWMSDPRETVRRTHS